MTIPLWAVAVLLAAEYSFFSFAFDSAALRQRHDLWVLAGYTGSLGVFLAAAVTGIVLVARTTRSRARLLLLARPIDIYGMAALTGHAASVVLFWWLTSRVLAASGPPPGPAAGWLILWTLAAGATPLLAGAAAFPVGRFVPALVAHWPVLVAGTLIGAGAWLASQGSAILWAPLGPWTVDAVERVLRVVIDAPYHDRSALVIGSDRFQVAMNPTCSGFEGVGLMTVFVVAYLVIARHDLRFPQALLLLPLGIAASLATNIVRIVALILVGTYMSPAVAAGGFHARAGWLFFCVIALTLVLLSNRLRFFAHEPAEARLAHPTAAYLMPFLMLVGVGLLTGLASARFDALYGARILAAAAALVAFRRYYRAVALSWSLTAVALGLVAAAAFIVLSPRPDSQSWREWHQEWLALPFWGVLCWTMIRALGSIVIVPLAEELAFRGYLLRRLMARDFQAVPPDRLSVGALLVSSAAFAAVHHGWLAGLVAGLLFGLVQIRGRNIGHAVVAHAVSNAAVAAYVLGFGQWWLWM